MATRDVTDVIKDPKWADGPGFRCNHKGSEWNQEAEEVSQRDCDPGRTS